LRWHGLARISYFGDELEDQKILEDLLQYPDPFEDSLGHWQALDQARLPYHVTALAMLALGRRDIMVGRAVSVACAVAVVAAVYWLGTLWFGPPAALIAAALQALSIYDIGFSRFSMTSSLSLFVLLHLCAIGCCVMALRTGRLRWYLFMGAATGAATAAKFFGIITLGLVCGAILAQRRATGRAVSVGAGAILRRVAAYQAAAWLIFGILAVVEWVPAYELAFFAVTALLLIAIHAAVAWEPMSSVEHRRPWCLALLVTSLAGLTFLLASPEHLSVDRVRAVFEWIPRWHATGSSTASWWALWATLFVRLGVPWNVVTAVAFGAAAWPPGWAPGLAVAACFAPMAIFSASRWQLTWYLMMVVPLCHIMVAGWLARRTAWPRPVFVVAVVLVFSWQGVRMRQLFPHYQLDGARWGVGLNRPAMPTFEGIPSVIAWLNGHVTPETTVAYLMIADPRLIGYIRQHLDHADPAPTFRYVVVSEVSEAVSASPVVVASCYSEAQEPGLIAAGYRLAQIVWLKDVRYAAVYTRPELLTTWR